MAYHHNPSSSLMAAVESGNLAAVTEALSRSPNLQAKRNRDCIKTAVMNDGKQYQQILGALLEYGLTVNPSDANHARFLHAAVEKGCLQVVEDLLKYGAKVNEIIEVNCSTGLSALQRAARNNHQEIAELLINYGANPLIGSHWSETPMFYFVTKANIKLINLLMASNPNYKRNNNVLHTAVISNNLEMVQTLLQHGVAVTTRDKTRRTSLHVNSCIEGKPDFKVQLAKLLLSKGADVDARNASNDTPLHLASAQADSVELAEVLLRHNANVNAVNHYGETPLVIAAGKGHKQLCAILIKHGAMVNMGTNIGNTPLCISSCRGHAEVVNLLLESGAILKLKNEDEPSALHEAIKASHEKVVEVLLKWGADFNAKRFWVNSLVKPTRERAWMRNGGIVQLILDRGADAQETSWGGCTALHIAAEEGSVAVAEVLLRHNANVHAVNEKGETPLHIAAEKGSVAVAEVLLRHNANVHAVNEKGKTPLHIAATYGHKETCVFLIKQGAVVNVKTIGGLTPLYIASRGGHANVVKILLESGAILKDENEVEPSALLEAIRVHQEKVVDILLKWGADFNAKRFWAHSLAEYEMKAWMGSEMIIQMFINRGVDINEPGWDGYTALHFAAKYDHHRTMRILLKFGAKINALTASNSSTPLCLVAGDSCCSPCETLLEYGAAVNLANANNETPLFRAAKYGCLHTVVALLNYGADINIASNTNEIALAKAIEGCIEFNNFRKEMGPDIDDEWPEYNKGHLCKDIVNTLIRHFVKLQMKNMFVSNENIRAVQKIKGLKNYQLKCEAEVAKMACDQLPQSEMTYFDILGKSVSAIANLMNNECIRQELQSEQYKLKYYYYREELKQIINQGLEMRKRLDQGEMLIKLVYPAMPQVCIDHILSFLRNEDILMK